MYEDEDIECFFVGNPRADGHMCIATMEHYHDMSEAPDYINEKRGSGNFVKTRKAYEFDKDKFEAVRTLIETYALEK